MKRAILALGLLIFIVVGPLMGEDVVNRTRHIQAQAPSPSATFSDETGSAFYQVGIFPRAMSYDGALMWVANWYDNTVTQLEGDNGRVVDTLTFQNLSNNVAQGPVALAWDGGFMWVAFYQDNLLLRVNPNTNQVETAFGPTDGIQAPVALLYDNANIWVLNQGRVGTAPGYLRKFETRLLSPVGDRCTVGRWPTAMTWDGSRIWVANALDNTVSVYNAANCTEEPQVISVKSFPMTLAYDGIHVWVGHYDGEIVAIDANSLKIDASIKVDNLPGNPQRPIQLLYAFEHIWVTDVHAGSFAIIRALDGTVITQAVPLGTEFPATIGYTDDEIWVADWLNQQVVKHDPLSVWLADPSNDPAVITRTPGIPLPSPTATNTPTPTITPTPCDTEFPQRLIVGGRGVVNRDFPDRLRLRDNPGSTGTGVLDLYPPGTEFDVLDGPICIDAVAWWRVSVDGSEGWFAETLRQTNGFAGYTVDPIVE